MTARDSAVGFCMFVAVIAGALAAAVALNEALTWLAGI